MKSYLEHKAKEIAHVAVAVFTDGYTDKQKEDIAKAFVPLIYGKVFEAAVMGAAEEKNYRMGLPPIWKD